MPKTLKLEGLPITEVLELARFYAADDWDHAANLAASPEVEQLCRAVARFRRSEDDDA